MRRQVGGQRRQWLDDVSDGERATEGGGCLVDRSLCQTRRPAPTVGLRPMSPGPGRHRATIMIEPRHAAFAYLARIGPPQFVQSRSHGRIGAILECALRCLSPQLPSGRREGRGDPRRDTSRRTLCMSAEPASERKRAATPRMRPCRSTALAIGSTSVRTEPSSWPDDDQLGEPFVAASLCVGHAVDRGVDGKVEPHITRSARWSGPGSFEELEVGVDADEDLVEGGQVSGHVPPGAAGPRTWLSRSGSAPAQPAGRRALPSSRSGASGGLG